MADEIPGEHPITGNMSSQIVAVNIEDRLAMNSEDVILPIIEFNDRFGRTVSDPKDAHGFLAGAEGVGYYPCFMEAFGELGVN